MERIALFELESKDILRVSGVKTCSNDLQWSDLLRKTMISLCELDWVLCPNTTLRCTFLPDINWIHHECTVQVRRKLGRAQAIIGLESPRIRYTWCIENTVTVNSFAIPKLPGSRVFTKLPFTGRWRVSPLCFQVSWPIPSGFFCQWDHHQHRQEWTAL